MSIEENTAELSAKLERFLVDSGYDLAECIMAMVMTAGQQAVLSGDEKVMLATHHAMIGVAEMVRDGQKLFK